MKLTPCKILIRLNNQFNINVFQFLSNKHNFRSFSNTSALRNAKTKLAKPNLYVGQKKYFFSATVEKIGFYGLFLLCVPIGTFLLGTWQVYRRNWKLNLIQNLNERITCEPIELPRNLQQLESMEYYPIKVQGRFIYEKEFIIGPRTLIKDGEHVNDTDGFISRKDHKGYHVITPFKLSNQDLTILVNRGWIPKALKNIKHTQKDQSEREVEIVGILRSHETRPPFTPKSNPNTDLWHYRDVNAMAEKANTSPIYIDMVHNENFPQYPVGSQTKVKLRNEHLSYIITWYSLSFSTAFMWYQEILKKARIVH